MPANPDTLPGSSQRMYVLQEARSAAIRGKELGITGLLPLQQFVERRIRSERLAQTSALLRSTEGVLVLERDDGDHNEDGLNILEIARTAAQEVINQDDREDRDQEEEYLLAVDNMDQLLRVDTLGKQFLQFSECFDRSNVYHSSRTV